MFMKSRTFGASWSLKGKKNVFSVLIRLRKIIKIYFIRGKSFIYIGQYSAYVTRGRGHCVEDDERLLDLLPRMVEKMIDEGDDSI